MALPQKRAGPKSFVMEKTKKLLKILKSPTLVEKLEAGHPIHTLMAEHDKILEFLKKLENVGQKIGDKGSFNEAVEDIGNLVHIADHLIEAELHLKREEDVLFPELESRGVFGPTEVMRLEHENIRAEEKELKELILMAKSNFSACKERLSNVAKYIVFNLRSHISKENNILYPAALDAIDNISVWEKMREKCDAIGYCCFTPEHGHFRKVKK